MNYLFWFVFFISILSLFYCGLITVYAGFGTTFSGFWLVAGIVGLLISAGIRFMLEHDVIIVPGFCFLIYAIIILGIGFFVIIEGTLIYHANSQADLGINYIIILGAQVRGTKITRALRKRLDTAYLYLSNNRATTAIVSGGKGDREAITEAEAMSKYLIDKGIEPSQIIKEDRSRNTFENILYSKPLLRGNSTVAIVTNGFHMFRALSLAKKQGLLQVQGISAPTDKILAVNYYVREAIGVMKDKLLGNI